MCIFQQLYAGEEGYVVRCRECSYYQIAFGTTVINMSKSELDAMRGMIVHQLQHPNTAVNDEAKAAWLPTPFDGYSLILSFKELRLLEAMLSAAETEEISLSLLECFDQNKKTG